MKKHLPFCFALLVGAVLFGPSALQAKDFEGSVQMTLSNGKNQSHQLTYSIKPGFIRTDFRLSDAETATAIMNIKADEMIVLMPGQSVYMSMPLTRGLSTVTKKGTDDATQLVNTGVTEKILGYTCTKYLAKSSEGETEIWATDQLGTFMGLGNALGGNHGSVPLPGWEQSLVGKDFFPLRVIGSENNRHPFRLEATAVEPKSLPDSMFTPPAGYHKFSLPGMVGQLLDR